jgi:large subunit ribosomal protein L29
MSKRGAHVEELRAMSSDELQEHLRQQRRRLFEVRFQQATGQVENHRQIRVLRREIARALTVQIEMQGLEALAPVEPVPPVPTPSRRRGRAAKSEPEPPDEAVSEEEAENGG